MSAPNFRLLTQKVRHPAIRLVLTTTLLAGTQSVFAVLSARWLGPGARGVFTVAVVIATFSLLLGSLGVFTGGRVLLSRLHSGIAWRDYWLVVVLLTGLQALIVAFVNVPMWWTLAGDSSKHMGPTLAYAAYCLSLTSASLAREGVHGIGKHMRAVVSDAVAAGTQLILALILVLLDKVNVTSLLLVGCVGFLVQLAICWCTMPIGVGRHSAKSPRLLTAKRVVLFSFPSIFLSVGQMFIQKGDRIILGVFAPPSDVGIYAAGATIADAAWILPVSVSVIVLRQVAAQSSLQPLARWRPAILLGTSVSAVFVAVVSSTLISVLLGPEYAGAVHIVWILCGGSVLFASQQVDIAACNGLGRLDVGAKTSCLGSVVLLVLSLFLMPRYGAVGAAYASVCAYACMAISVRLVTRRLKVPAAP